MTTQVVSHKKFSESCKLAKVKKVLDFGESLIVILESYAKLPLRTNASLKKLDLYLQDTWIPCEGDEVSVCMGYGLSITLRS